MVQSQLIFGDMLCYGRGVPTDVGQAEQWYRQAAAAGSEQAQINLDALTAKRSRLAVAPLIHLALFTAICVGVRESDRDI